jgi:phospholipase/lecithinase/hemolysin
MDLNASQITLAKARAVIDFKRVRALVIGVVVLLFSKLNVANSLSNVIFIGDSNTDNGRPHYLPLNGTTHNPGIYTTPNGFMWSVYLSQFYGFSVSPNLGTSSENIAPGVGYSNNYAMGGARIYDALGVSNNGDSSSNIDPIVWSATQQVQSLLTTTGARLNPNVLYVYDIGTNDLKSNYNNLAIIGGVQMAPDNGHGTYVDGVNYANSTANIDPSIYNPGAMYTSGLNLLASQSAQNVIDMAQAGARYIVVSNINTTTSRAAAEVAGLVDIWTPMAQSSVLYYNQTLWNNIAAAGVNFIPADFLSLIDYVALHAGSFGFTNTLISQPACVYPTQAIDCTFAQLNSDPNSYIFADFIGHFSSAAQLIQAEYVQSLLEAPSAISIISETGVQNTLSLMDVFHQQIPMSFNQPDRFQAWVSGGVTQNNMKQAQGFARGYGSPMSITLGGGYRLTDELILGAAYSDISLTQAYSSGGHFAQNANEFTAVPATP